MSDRGALKSIIERYTPTLLDVSEPAPAEDIARLAAAAGPLPDSYRTFLEWMGNRCPFLDGEDIAYQPWELLEIYDDPDDAVPDGFILVGIDTSGSSFDVHIRRTDGVVLRLSEYYDGVTNQHSLIKNVSFESFLLSAYVQRTLVPSHPFHFAAGFQAEPARLQELWARVEEACGNFEISHRITHPDMRFYGGNDFVLGVYQRPQSAVVNLYFGAIERARYEPWYDLVFARWRLQRMPT
jgi:hypothetical protein